MATTTAPLRTGPAERHRRGRPGPSVVAAAAFGGACLAAAAVGGVVTAGTTDSAWFAALDKPAFYPPGWAFGAVWTPLYVMIAASGWLAWRQGAGRRPLALWGVQLALNLGWTVVFFGLRRPGWALVEIVVLAAAIVATALAFRPVDRRAAALLVPYALWVGFATALTAAIAAAG